MLRLQHHLLMVKGIQASLNISAGAHSSQGKLPPHTSCLVCKDWESSSRDHLVQFSTARQKSILYQIGKIIRLWKNDFWQLSMTAWKAALKTNQTKQQHNKKNKPKEPHPPKNANPLKGSTKVCHALPVEQGDLQPQQVNIHHLQPPLWAVCPQHHTRAGSAVPNSLAHLK